MRHRIACLLFGLLASASQASDSLTIVLHHNVSDTTPRSTSVSPDEFEYNLQQLQAEGFTVVSLPEALEALQSGKALPKQAVAITFDDADKSVYQHAFPLLKKYDMPFTVFVNTEPVDKSYGRAMSWDMLRELKQAGATIANHSTSHDYLIRSDAHDEAWLNNVMADLEHAQERLENELGETPKMVAYPYGEYNNALKQNLAEQGWIGFAQHSGAIDANSDFSALPRFSADGNYSRWQNLRVKLMSRPLPVDYLAMPDPVVREAGKPELTLQMRSLSNVRSDALRCYVQGEVIEPSWSDDQSSFTVAAMNELNKGRTRYTCTTPAKRGGYYYWMSYQWVRY